MTAILALWIWIPTKDKLYGAAGLALLFSFWWYSAHERNVGAERVRTAQAAAATAQAQLAAERTQYGANDAHSAEVRYVSTINAATVNPPHLLVLDSGSATAAVCAAAYPTERDAETDSTVEHPRDVGPDLDKIGRDADAQVTYLQSILRSCIDIGACKLQ